MSIGETVLKIFQMLFDTIKYILTEPKGWVGLAILFFIILATINAAATLTALTTIALFGLIGFVVYTVVAL